MKDKLKHWLLEVSLVHSDLTIISGSKSYVCKQIRKHLRMLAKAESFAYINVIKNDLKPTCKGERSYWWVSKDDYVKKDQYKNFMFKDKPSMCYKHSEYRVEVGVNWLLKVLHEKDTK